jgi:hypothetical protein
MGPPAGRLLTRSAAFSPHYRLALNDERHLWAALSSALHLNQASRRKLLKTSAFSVASYTPALHGQVGDNEGIRFS